MVNPANLRPNNFDIIRLVAALQVVLFHSYENLGIEMPSPLQVLGIFPGVPVFFVVSGFLISNAWMRNPCLRSYAASRILRIFPGLWICFGVSVLSVIALRPDLLLTVPWEHAVIWVAAQMSFLQVLNPEFLRDFGVGALNGSLWTIPVELQFYVAVPLLFKWFSSKKNSNKYILAGIGLGLIFNQIYVYFRLTENTMLVKLFGITWLPHMWLFLVGVLLQQNFTSFRKIFAGYVLQWGLAHLAVCYVGNRLGYSVTGNLIAPVPAITLVGFVMACAYSRSNISDRTLRGNDLSYGIYLYHMVIVNVLIECHVLKTNGTILFVFLASAVAAVFSWRLIEKPAISFKKLFHCT